MEQLQEIIRLLKSEGLTEITIADGDQRITVRRDGGVSIAPPATASAPSADAAPLLDEVPGTFTLTAPLVGTFYLRPSPEADPFVSPGDIVGPTEAVCIIEAMKVMNEIHADGPGRLLRVLVEEGEAVEYGQPLMTFDRL